MLDLSYDLFNVRVDRAKKPLIRIKNHFYYPLQQTDDGKYSLIRGLNNKPLKCPRRLLALCIRKLIQNECFLLLCIQQQLLSTNIYYSMAQEAIFNCEYQILEILISCWPCTRLDITKLIPVTMSYNDDEDNVTIQHDYLSIILEKKLQDGSTLLDYISMGIVNKQPRMSRLKIVDFRACSSSIQMTKEVCRLPLLWISPTRRSANRLLLQMKHGMCIDKVKLEQYLDGFNYVYQFYDKSISHEINSGSLIKHGFMSKPIKILLDCHIVNEDTLLGLQIQQLTPFRFHFRKLWISYYIKQCLMANTSFDLNPILFLTNVETITHLHLSDINMDATEKELTLLVRCLSNLRNLRVLCLQRILNLYPQRYTHVHFLTDLCQDFNRLFRRLIYLRKLDLSYSYLRSHIRTLLTGLIQPLDYLNLQDCRLTSIDIEFINSMRNIRYIRELNLSMNDFSTCSTIIINIVEKIPNLVSLSLAYCQLNPSTLVQLATCFKSVNEQKTSIRYLSLKGFIPYLNWEFLDLLHAYANLMTLKKLLLFPQLYAYPGANDDEREITARDLYRRCCTILQTLGRTDLELL
ncbi:unnamed protein product [Didymodactylos carnosus]|uniref:Uncharacterized protein n=1 Tax=Didymodactylos carnosus TaxID=1234261 RepID=A0A813S4S4_9BILA|nr:unnamed protein product [Didymodactylos carnosus]CAF3575111.1 unnamed protein product [Didymodactylos carnosus]